MKKPIRILHVIAGMGSGGAEMMIMNWYRHMDRSQVQFDFLLRSDENIYKDEILSMGGRIFVMPDFPKHVIGNHLQTKQFFRLHSGEYAAIHVHANALIYMDALFLAKKCGIRHRIMHSHNTRTEIPLYEPVHKFNKLLIKNYATDFWACSDTAGKFMFSSGFRVVNNAIDLNKYEFDAKIREAVRREYHFDDHFVVGHVGRFLKSKNHAFLIKIFKKIKEKQPDALLALIGTGTLENQIRAMVHQNGLDDSVLFLGVQKNVPDYYMGFDVLVFPSFFEGLGIVAVESQAAGLPAICSEAIPQEARITDGIMIKSLHEPITAWADAAIGMAEKGRNQDGVSLMAARGYDIETETHKLQDFYLSMR